MLHLDNRRFTNAHRTSKRPLRNKTYTKKCKHRGGHGLKSHDSKYSLTKHRNSLPLVERLFLAVLNASYQIQKIAPEEGRESWQPIKVQFADKSYGLQWKPIAVPIRKFALNMIDETADGKTITKIHYFRQQIRIPSEEALNMRRLLQVALNIGQWKALPKAVRDSVIPAHHYKKLRLDTIRRYITREQEKTLASGISQKTYDFVIDYCNKIRSFPWRTKQKSLRQNT